MSRKEGIQGIVSFLTKILFFFFLLNYSGTLKTTMGSFFFTGFVPTTPKMQLIQLLGLGV